MGDPPDKRDAENAKRKPGSPLSEGSVAKKGRDMWTLLYKVCTDIFSADEVEEDTKQALRELKGILEMQKNLIDRETQVNQREIQEDKEIGRIAELIQEAKEENQVKELLQMKWPELVYHRTKMVPP